MGIHTGDSLCPSPNAKYQRLRDAAIGLSADWVETGGSNIQFAVNPVNGEFIVIEMNPPQFCSGFQATGFPIVSLQRNWLWATLDEIKMTSRRKHQRRLSQRLTMWSQNPRFAFESFRLRPGVDYADEVGGKRWRLGGRSRSFKKPYGAWKPVVLVGVVTELKTASGDKFAPTGRLIGAIFAVRHAMLLG